LLCQFDKKRSQLHFELGLLAKASKTCCTQFELLNMPIGTFLIRTIDIKRTKSTHLLFKESIQ
jgi:hypothetical protein